METTPIFSISQKQIGELTPSKAVELFRDLLWAEARRIGISLSKIHISLWINVPDGGIDASVDESVMDLTKSSGLIKIGFTGYQIKAGTSFHPWQDSDIKKELFGRKHPSRENLGASVRTCLDKKGTYVLVCFGQELSEDQHKQAVKTLTYYFEQCNYKKPKVEVWGQSTIIGYLQIFPSLVLQLQGFDQSRFQTHKSWSQNDDMRKEFKAGTAQVEFIKNIQEELRKNDQAVHIRIWGEPGAGKTRLVLETTSAEDLMPLVVYCDSPAKFRDSNLMNEITKEDNHFSLLLVIDECDPDSRSYIWNKLKNLGSRIKLVSVYNEYDTTSGNIVYFDTPPLLEQQISAIIQEYGVQKNQADRWSELCSGSPRVAHVIGWNLKNNPDDILKPLDTANIWDRYIIGGDDPLDEEVKQRKVVLQHIALFKRFGFESAVVHEAQALAGIIEQADRLITWPRFQQIIRKLR